MTDRYIYDLPCVTDAPRLPTADELAAVAWWLSSAANIAGVLPCDSPERCVIISAGAGAGDPSRACKWHQLERAALDLARAFDAAVEAHGPIAYPIPPLPKETDEERASAWRAVLLARGIDLRRASND